LLRAVTVRKKFSRSRVWNCSAYYIAERDLRDDVLSAENDFRGISTQSDEFTVKIQDDIANERGYYQRESNRLRELHYGITCASVCVVTGPITSGISCAACYAIVAPIIETEIANMKRNMERTVTALYVIGNDFTSTAGTVDELGDLALEQAEV
jgi:hypothetical protein